MSHLQSLNYEHNYKSINFVFLYTAKIQSAGYSVFSNTSTTDEAAKTVGKQLVDAKVSQLEISLHTIIIDQLALWHVDR